MKNATAVTEMFSQNIAELLESSHYKEESGNYFGAIEDLERCKEFLKRPKNSKSSDSRYHQVCNNIGRLMNIVAMVFLRKG
jgi:hypothetical protein